MAPAANWVTGGRGLTVAIGAWACLASACTRTPLEPIQIPFAAAINGTPFACDRTYDGLGTRASAFSPSDLRFYVHDFALLSPSGHATPVTLVDDGRWQGDGVVLLDFEDGTAHCANGTAGTHTVIQALAPRGDYAGLRFTLGVPFERNHLNPVEAKPPLSLGQMHWGWQAGYKFLRFEGSTTDGHGFRVHLGSTGCEGTFGKIVRCARPDRPTIELDHFRSGDTVVIDLASVLNGVNLSAPPGDATVGCMSEADDPDCAAPLAALGLDVKTGAATSRQHAFAVRHG
jgi:uncharacterized repeat protein (TIGR04052 family)